MPIPIPLDSLFTSSIKALATAFKCVVLTPQRLGQTNHQHRAQINSREDVTLEFEVQPRKLPASASRWRCVFALFFLIAVVVLELTNHQANEES